MKKRYKPFKLLAYEALFRRLLPKYRGNDTIQSNYLKLNAGQQGERNMDYKLTLFPRKDFLHLPDIRLKHHNNCFQMDSVIVTPKLIFILEAKHMKGILEYHGAERQLIQIIDNQKKCYKDPILQAKTQAKHLYYWLQQLGWHIPVKSLVVSTNQQAMIKNMDNHADFTTYFTTLENLPYKLEECFSTFQKNILQPSQQHKLAHLLISHHLPAKSSLLQQLNLQSHHLIKGVACPDCDFSPLRKLSPGWYCTKCRYQGYADYERVLLDHFILHNAEYITNRMCRDNLQIDSRNTAYFFLKTMNLKVYGNRKGRKYLSPTVESFPQNAAPKQFEYSIFH